MKEYINKFLDLFLHVQKKYAVYILIIGILLTVLAAPRGIKLLTTIKTDLIHLLPDHYPSVHYTEEIQKKFNRRSSLYLIIHSPDKEVNKKAMFAARDYLLELPSVDYVEITKKGYDFFDSNKLLLIDIKDLYEIHDRLKDRIHKEKLGALYIDFEDDGEKEKEVTFDDLIKKYKEDFAEGVRDKYKTSDDGHVFVLNIYPKSTDSSLKYFKKFGEEIEDHVNKFDFVKFSPDIGHGYAGAIVTRVDQYSALIRDLKRAGIVSASSIFLLLYFYFAGFVQGRRRTWRYWLTPLMRIVPVVVIFLPMIMSTLLAFWFCSHFFTQLNVVTSFLFVIIFGLGVDIGIHLITRYLQDSAIGISIDKIHKNVAVRTGKSCAIGILTTVASFYILTINDFKGFSEFGWIAGNGLVIALLCYLIFFPCLLLLIDRYKLIDLKTKNRTNGHTPHKRKWLPYPKILFGISIVMLLISLVDISNLQFEWNFGKLKLKESAREYQKSLLKQTVGRINSAAVYLIENEVQARKIRQEIRFRSENDKDFDTIQFYRSWYDMTPFDQDEKLAVLQDINILLSDDALNTLNDEEKDLVEEFQKAIAETKPIDKNAIPDEVHEIFWGTSGNTKESVAFIMPLPHLELENGNNAKAFYKDVHIVDALGKRFYGLSDAMIFAEVLQTLFKDAKTAIFLALLTIMILISWHFRNFQKSLFVFISLGFGIVLMLGLMSFFNIKLNFYNMIIIPAMIGMGVDNSVHVIHRFDEIKHRSIVEVLRTSGGAALMASLTTILGYSGMNFTHHPGLNSIGLMAIIGMGTCLVGSLFVLPLLLQMFVRNDRR